MEKFIIHFYMSGIMYVDFCHKTKHMDYEVHIYASKLNLLKQYFKPFQEDLQSHSIWNYYPFLWLVLQVLQLQAVQNEWSLTWIWFNENLTCA